MIELPKMTFCKILPDLPKPLKLRRQVRKDGGYDMVPAYTDEEMFKYGEVCAAEAREKMREECLLLITQSAKQYNREANGGDNSGASDHKQDACELLANEIKELP